MSYKADFNIRQFWQLLSFSKYLLLFDIAELSLLHRADTRGTERPFMALTHPPTHNNNLILRPLRNENLFLIDRLASGVHLPCLTTAEKTAVLFLAQTYFLALATSARASVVQSEALLQLQEVCTSVCS